MDSLFAVLSALGVTSAMLAGVNPYNNDAARARMDDILTARTAQHRAHRE